MKSIILFNKKLLSKNLVIPENNKLVKLSISNIALHGVTDIYYNNPTVLIKKYLLSYTILKKLSPMYKFYTLLISSIFHIRNDIGILNSVFLHILWVFKPNLSLTYLSLIHVPLHYLNAFNNNIPAGFIVFLNLLSILISFLPINKIKEPDKMWWVWIVLGHIMVVK
tara:strand:- start:164 stop:664 length:501 start_codon:yes stop_codon:yes gene_type:complete